MKFGQITVVCLCFFMSACFQTTGETCDLGTNEDIPTDNTPSPYLSGGEAELEWVTADHIKVYVNTDIEPEHFQALLEAVEYYETLWSAFGYNEQFDIRFVDYDPILFDKHERRQHRTISVSPLLPGQRGTFGHAYWLSGYDTNEWSGDILFKPSSNTAYIEYKVMFLHELGHVFGLDHVKNAYNAMNEYVTAGGFNLTDEQTETVVNNIFANFTFSEN